MLGKDELKRVKFDGVVIRFLFQEYLGITVSVKNRQCVESVTSKVKRRI